MQPAESSVFETTVVTLSAYLCLCLCSFLHYASLMQCFAVHVGFLTCL